MTDGDIVFRPTNSIFNMRGPCTLFFLPNIVSVTISCNDNGICIFVIGNMSLL